jgi:hypothetical protein
MSTLQELTLALSKDLTANQKARDAALDRIEQERAAAVRALPGASAPLQQFARAQADAEASRREALAEIDARLRTAEREAGLSREAALTEADARMKDADGLSERAKEDAVAKANAAFQADLERIAKTHSLDAQILARRDAQRKRDDAIDSANRALHRALQDNKNLQLDERQAALDAELIDSREAREDAEGARLRAQELFERTLDRAETRLALDLGKIDGAAELQAGFDARRAAVRDEFRRREEALFAAFGEARKKIGAAHV